MGHILLALGGTILTIGILLYLRSITRRRNKVLDVFADLDPWMHEIRDRTLQSLLLLNIVGVLVASIGFGTILVGVLTEQQSAAKPLSERILKLTSSLQERARAVDEAQEEIAARQRLVDKLRNDQQTYEALRRMDKPTADAVANVLEGKLAESERKARLATWLIIPLLGAFLSCLGI